MYDTSLKAAHSLLESCPVALLLVAENGNICGFNAAFRTLVGEAADLLKDTPQPDGLIAPLPGSDTVMIQS